MYIIFMYIILFSVLLKASNWDSALVGYGFYENKSEGLKLNTTKTVWLKLNTAIWRCMLLDKLQVAFVLGVNNQSKLNWFTRILTSDVYDKWYL